MNFLDVLLYILEVQFVLMPLLVRTGVPERHLNLDDPASLFVLRLGGHEEH